ncbi:MAG: PorT family protein [Bacteroidales bacterium]|nr:PorT family protein [Bacteroidales bacterium]
MRKATVLLAIIILIWSTNEASGKTRRKSYGKRARIGSIEVGGRTIVGISNVYGKFYEIPGEFKPSVNLEIVGSWLFNKDITLLTGLGYGYYGSDMTNTNPSSDKITLETHTYKLHYLTIPVQVEFTVNNFFIGVGPQVNILLKANDYIQRKTDNNPKLAYFTLEDIATVNNIDVGGRVSLGYKFSSNLKLELSYFNSFTDLTFHPSKNDERVISKNYNTNAFIGIGISYLISVK